MCEKKPIHHISGLKKPHKIAQTIICTLINRWKQYISYLIKIHWTFQKYYFTQNAMQYIWDKLIQILQSWNSSNI